MPTSKDIKSVKKKFYISLIFVVLALVYLVWPLDLIPFFIGDDLAVIFLTFFYSAFSLFKMKRQMNQEKKEIIPSK